MYSDEFERPMTVKQRRDFLQKQLLKMEKRNPSIQPIRAMSSRKKLGDSYWAQAWCQHIESYADYDYRVDRGRSYLRQGAVLDLHIDGLRVDAKVYGAELYSIQVVFQPLDSETIKNIQSQFENNFLSSLDVLSGDFSENLKDFLKDQGGLFPPPHEFTYSCNCLDDADLCKHIAAVLYGIGLRFDADSSLFFTLRGLNPLSLVKQPSHGTASGEIHPENKQREESLFDLDFL